MMTACGTRFAALTLAGIALAVGLQVVVDLPVPGSVSLRLSLADMVLPILLLASGAVWVTSGRPAPGWRLPSLPLWLALVTAMLTAALAVAAWRTGQVSNWALVNKYFGWFVLIAYLLAGASLRLLPPLATQGVVLRWLLAAGVMACLWSIGLREAIALDLVALVPHPQATPLDEVLGLVWSRYRMSGFVVNSNTFGFIVGGLALVQLPLIRHGLVLSPGMHLAVQCVLLPCVFYSGSRAAFGSFLVGLAVLALLRQLPWRPFIGALLGAALLAGAMQAVPFVAESMGAPAAERTISVLVPNVENPQSVQSRVSDYLRALELWRQAPLTGIGLGGFIADQVAQGVRVPQVIHGTWLWLLVETGPAGLACFILFMAALVRALWRDRADPLVAGALALMALVGTMALVHELLYQRLIWLVLGMALVRAPALSSPGRGQVA